MDSDFTEEQLEGIKLIFQNFDKNKNGELTTRELGILMGTFGQNATEAELQEMLKHLADTGREGIDFQEFVSMLSKSMRQECTDEEYAAVFKVYDTDGSGLINSDKFRAIMKSLGENLSKEQAEEMIMEADSDGDGMLNLGEFIAMMRE